MILALFGKEDENRKVKEFNSIREFYRPIQPAVRRGNKKIYYEEVWPVKEIENFVYCCWQLKTMAPLEHPYDYRVVSDGCIDIFFNHNQPAENFVMGFSRKYTQFAIGTEFDYIGIRFLPSAFPLVFGHNAKELSNQSQELKAVLPNFSEWICTHILPKQTFPTIVKLLNEKLKNKITIAKFQLDPRFYRAMHLIFLKKGFLDIETDLETGLSPRQLRRIFNFYVGTTPKAFCDVVRFQHILNSKPSNQSLKENKFYFDVGFFDQAHFIHHFKRFYGVTPSQAFE